MENIGMQKLFLAHDYFLFYSNIRVASQFLQYFGHISFDFRKHREGEYCLGLKLKCKHLAVETLNISKIKKKWLMFSLISKHTSGSGTLAGTATPLYFLVCLKSGLNCAKMRVSQAKSLTGLLFHTTAKVRDDNKI